MAEALHRGPTLCIGVLAMNEGHRIGATLRSAAFADQVVVVDSGSTDDTVAVSQAAGAQVFSYPDWQGFGVQRTRLIEHATCDYVFFLDADEVITPALQAQIEAAVRSGQPGVWRVCWRIVAFGHELKAYRAGVGPERLFRRDMLAGYQGVVHEEAVLHPQFFDAPRRVLRAKLLHYSRETVHGSLDKLTQYVMLGAAKRAEASKRGGVLRGMAGGTSMFLRLYVLKLGFLCGGAGFLYCFFVALEAFFRYAALHYDRETLSHRVSR